MNININYINTLMHLFYIYKMNIVFWTIFYEQPDMDWIAYSISMQRGLIYLYWLI